MTQTSNSPGDFFIDSLYWLIAKTSAFLKTHAPRHHMLWAEFYVLWEPHPQTIRQVVADKQQFYQDIVYRVQVLRDLEQSMREGLDAIKQVLTTTYGKMLLDGAGLEKVFPPADIRILGYRVAEKLIGVLQRMISLAPQDVPLQYIIVAKNKAMLKLSPMSDEEVLKSLVSANIPCTLEVVRQTFADLEQAQLVQVDRKTPAREVYAHLKDFKLSVQGETSFSQKILPILDWCIQLWQSFYNVRELDVKIPDHTLWKTHVEQITAKAATQGFTNAYYVIKHLADYFEAVHNKQATAPPI